jgi:hypothetical protein
VRCVGPAWAQWVERTSSGEDVNETIMLVVWIRTLLGDLWKDCELPTPVRRLLNSFGREVRLQSWGWRCRWCSNQCSMKLKIILPILARTIPVGSEDGDILKATSLGSNESRFGGTLRGFREFFFNLLYNFLGLSKLRFRCHD